MMNMHDIFLVAFCYPVYILVNGQLLSVCAYRCGNGTVGYPFNTSRIIFMAEMIVSNSHIVRQISYYLAAMKWSTSLTIASYVSDFIIMFQNSLCQTFIFNPRMHKIIMLIVLSRDMFQSFSRTRYIEMILFTKVLRICMEKREKHIRIITKI